MLVESLLNVELKVCEAIAGSSGRKPFDDDVVDECAELFRVVDRVYADYYGLPRNGIK